jgi:hypothetical protein
MQGFAHRLPLLSKVQTWFGLSLVLPIYYGLVALQKAFSREYMVQDDARQHVFWMQRYLDPDLFPNDLIADYFQAVAPPGYETFYAVFAHLGISPFLLANLLPIGLGLITSIYLFWVSFHLFPVPSAAFLTSTIITQALWLEDDLISATGRAFLYPIFAAFLYYLLKRSLLPCLLTVILQALFFPAMSLVQAATLTVRLLDWRKGRLQLSQRRFDWLIWLLGSSFTVGLLLLFQRDTGVFAPVVTRAQMLAMPEFNPGGRIVYFVSNPFRFWWMSNGGINPLIYPPIALLAFLFPVVYGYPQLSERIQILLKIRLKQSSRSRQLPLDLSLRQLSSALHQSLSLDVRILSDLLLGSFGLWLLAHLLLGKLYFPNRYTQHSLRVIMSIATGILLTLMLKAGWIWLRQQRWQRLRFWQQFLIGFVSLFLLASIVVPALPAVTLSALNFVRGRSPELYQYLSQQPKETLVASLAKEADNLPTFAARSVLFSEEHALPMHLGYYTPIKARILDVINAQYSTDPAVVKAVIQKYGIDFLLINDNAFTADYLSGNNWLKLFQPATDRAIATLETKQTPVLAGLMQSCSVVQTNGLYLVSTSCVLSRLEKQ